MSASSSRVWLISGANTGLGLELALKVLLEGERVIAAVRTPSKIPDSLKVDSVKTIAFDLTWSQAKINSFAQEAWAAFGKIDVVVNNAGFGYFGAIEESEDDALLNQFDINVFGIVRVLRAVLPNLRAQKSGTIVNISSVGGLVSPPGNGLYCATKHALEAITQSLAAEIAPFGIRALAVEPGYFRTEFLKNPAAGQAIAPRIPEYDGTPARDATDALSLYNGRQPGDPKIGAVRMWEAVTGEGLFKGKKVFGRVVLGTDSATYIRNSINQIGEILDEYEEVWKSTDIKE